VAPSVPLRPRFVARSTLGSGIAFFLSRALSAALILGQLAVVASLFSAEDTATFFVLWTLVWGGSVWLRFGVDQLIPRHAAGARLSGDLGYLGVARDVLGRTTPALAVALLVLTATVVPGLSVLEVLAATGLCLAAAFAWAVIVLLAALLRGYDRVGRSGVVQGLIPSLALLCACAAARLGGDHWLALLIGSTLALWFALFVAMLLTAAAVDVKAIRALLFDWSPVDREQVAAGMLTFIAEAGLAFPVLLASALGASSVEVAGLYAAARVAAVFSWPAGAVAAVAAPRLAEAIARRQGVARLLRTATVAAAASSIPLAVVGMLWPQTFLSAMSQEYEPYGALLVILIAGRLVDACAGPLAEALILGERARQELINTCVFACVAVGGGALLWPAHGAQGLATAVALGTAVCNVPRLIAVRRALSSSWVPAGHSEQPASAQPQPITPAVRALSLVGLCAAFDLAVAAGLLDAVDHRVLLALVIGGVAGTFAVAVAEARRRASGAWSAVIASPLIVAVVAWGAIFGLRPLELWLWPEGTTVALTGLGFTLEDLTKAAAIGALGCAAWTLGYLPFLGPRRRPLVPALAREVEAMPRRRLITGLLLIGFGSLFWGALFIRQGGLSVLTSTPGALHNDGQSSGYAVLGVWIVQGVALYALIAWLRGGGRRAAGLLALATGLAVMAAITMQARGLLFLGVVAGVVIFLCQRTPSRRAAAAALAAGLIAIPALAFVQQVRTYSQSQSPREAVVLTLHTPPSTFQVSDLSVFDNLVTLRQLVPGSVPRLNGSSLADVPLAFVPRAVWPDKPQPVDQQVSAVLYPGSTAGTPVGLQGELLWNFGLPAVLLGALLVGALMGVLARARRVIRGPGALLLYGVGVASAVAPLTRALAPMTTNTGLALAGCGLVTGAMAPGVRHALTRTHRRVGAWIRALRDRAAPPAPAAGKRFDALDSLRALGAGAVVLAHVGVGLDAPNYSPVANLVMPPGQAAVMVFFLVSGFVLYRPFVAARADGRPEQSLRRFALRRIARVFPAYWALLTVFALLGGAPSAFSEDWWRYYLLAANYTNDPVLVEGGIPPAWTLAVEMSFYLMLIAFVALMRPLWRRRTADAWRWRLELLAPLPLVAIGVTFALVAIYNPDWAMAARTLLGTLHTFAIGMILAVVSVRAEHGWQLPRPLRALRDHSTVCALVAIACLVASYQAGIWPTRDDPFHTFGVDTYAGVIGLANLGAIALVAPVMLGAARGAPLMRFLHNRWLVWLGVVSYGTYLAHWQLVAWLNDPLRFAPLVPHLLVVLATVYLTAILIGAVSWSYLERPFMRAVARRRRRDSGSDPLDRVAPVRSPA
jgi:peptidoglycan/LPS O-acetylase OafA/YrhL